MKYSHDETGLPPPELYERVRAAIDGATPLRSRTSMRISFVLAGVPLLCALVVATASYVVYGQPAAALAANVASISRLWLVICLFGALTLAATYLALTQGRNGFGAAATILAVIACFIAPLYAALIIPDPLHASGTALEAAQISPWGTRCLLIASIVIGLSLCSFVFALRRAVTVTVRLRGAALGAAAGAWAGLALLFFCPAGEPLHLIIGHALPVLAATILGAVLTPAALRT